MSEFIVGQTVFYTDYQKDCIGSRIISGKDIVDNIPRYWLQGYFGYFDKGRLFETAQQAQDKLNQWKAIKEKFNDE